MGVDYRVKVVLPSRAVAEDFCRKAAIGCHVKLDGARADFYPAPPSSPSEWAHVCVTIKGDGFDVCLLANSNFARQVLGCIVQLAAGEGIVTVEEL
ncbi:hypothetical protein VLK31_20500 [Variovorax sp. H27-G14]|uniref:hypothetical protein n=1 Tax=Variovorax sp. H27-G14 TaxID=3111914 RepID=UPI0038FCDE39